MSNTAEHFQYDVVILGGGPAGTATALSLRQHAPSLSLAIIEQSTYEKIRIGETLTPLAQPLLEQLGVWSSFLEQHHVPAYGTCAAWGSDELIENEFIFQAGGRGWHLDRTRFDAMLASQAASRGATLFRGSKYHDSQLTGEKRWRLTVQTEDHEEITIEATFVVDATGRRAVFAGHQNSRRVVLDQLCGVFVLFAIDSDPPLRDTYTLVETWEEGWWYSALLPGNNLAVVCMSDADIIKRRRLSSVGEWLALMNQTQHTKKRALRATSLSSPSVHPAASHRLEKMRGESWLAVGDAAMTFDPLSSQGIFKGLRSGILASYAIADYFKNLASGLDKFEAILSREFEGYLNTRADFYRQEKRWGSSSFWQRRYDYITLDPLDRLKALTPANNSVVFDKVHGNLPVDDLKYLCELCNVARPAQEIVSDFTARRHLVSDRGVILALQQLLNEGLITSVGN